MHLHTQSTKHLVQKVRNLEHTSPLLRVITCYFLSLHVVPCREEVLSYQEPSLYSDCNSGCLCSRKEWDPVCGDNGITYVSPCLAGCVSSSGSGRNTVRSETCDTVTYFSAQLLPYVQGWIKWCTLLLSNIYTFRVPWISMTAFSLSRINWGFSFVFRCLTIAGA